MLITVNLTLAELKLILDSLQSTTLELRPMVDKHPTDELLDEMLAFDFLRIKLDEYAKKYERITA